MRLFAQKFWKNLVPLRIQQKKKKIQSCSYRNTLICEFSLKEIWHRWCFPGSYHVKKKDERGKVKAIFICHRTSHLALSRLDQASVTRTGHLWFKVSRQSGNLGWNYMTLIHSSVICMHLSQVSPFSSLQSVFSVHKGRNLFT